MTRYFFHQTQANGGSGGNAGNYALSAPPAACTSLGDLSTCPQSIGGRGAGTSNADYMAVSLGSTPGHDSVMSRPADPFTGGFGGMSFYETLYQGTTHRMGTQGTFGGGGGGAGNAYDAVISGSAGTLRSGDGENSSIIENMEGSLVGAFHNGDGGHGGAFGGAIFATQSNVFFSSPISPFFTNNYINFGSTENEPENLFLKGGNLEVNGSPFDFTTQGENVVHYNFNCSNQYGENCTCEDGVCNDNAP